MIGVPFKFSIADQEFEAIISKDDFDKVQSLLKKNEKKTGYERVNAGDQYYYDNGDGSIELDMEKTHSVDDRCYNAANYYSSEEVARNNARADRLMRQLRRFAVEHGSDNIRWTNVYRMKYSIAYNYDKQNLIVVGSTYTARRCGEVYFDTEANAKLALETFHDELIWYFTEYKDSL